MRPRTEVRAVVGPHGVLDGEGHRRVGLASCGQLLLRRSGRHQRHDGAELDSRRLRRTGRNQLALYQQVGLRSHRGDAIGERAGQDRRVVPLCVDGDGCRGVTLVIRNDHQHRVGVGDVLRRNSATGGNRTGAPIDRRSDDGGHLRRWGNHRPTDIRRDRQRVRTADDSVVERHRHRVRTRSEVEQRTDVRTTADGDITVGELTRIVRGTDGKGTGCLGAAVLQLNRAGEAGLTLEAVRQQIDAVHRDRARNRRNVGLDRRSRRRCGDFRLPLRRHVTAGLRSGVRRGGVGNGTGRHIGHGGVSRSRRVGSGRRVRRILRRGGTGISGRVVCDDRLRCHRSGVGIGRRVIGIRGGCHDANKGSCNQCSHHRGTKAHLRLHEILSFQER